MTLVWEKDYFLWRNQVSKAPTGPLSHKSDNKDYENSLESNKSLAGPLKASSSGPSQALSSEALTNIA